MISLIRCLEEKKERDHKSSAEKKGTRKCKQLVCIKFLCNAFVPMHGLHSCSAVAGDRGWIAQTKILLQVINLICPFYVWARENWFGSLPGESRTGVLLFRLRIRKKLICTIFFGLVPLFAAGPSIFVPPIHSRFRETLFFLRRHYRRAHFTFLIFPVVVHSSVFFLPGSFAPRKLAVLLPRSRRIRWRRKNVEPAWHRSPSSAALDRRLARPEFMIFESAEIVVCSGKSHCREGTDSPSFLRAYTTRYGCEWYGI